MPEHRYKRGDKVRVRLDFESEVKYTYANGKQVDVRAPGGATLISAIPVSALTPVVEPEAGDLWEADGITYVVIQRSFLHSDTGLYFMRVISLSDNPVFRSDAFLRDRPDATLVFRKGQPS